MTSLVFTYQTVRVRVPVVSFWLSFFSKNTWCSFSEQKKRKKKTFTRTARVPELVWTPPLYSDISWLQPWSADVMAAVTFGNLRIRSVDGAAAHTGNWNTQTQPDLNHLHIYKTQKELHELPVNCDTLRHWVRVSSPKPLPLLVLWWKDILFLHF